MNSEWVYSCLVLRGLRDEYTIIENHETRIFPCYNDAKKYYEKAVNDLLNKLLNEEEQILDNNQEENSLQIKTTHYLCSASIEGAEVLE